MKQYLSYRYLRKLNEKLVIPALRRIEDENDSLKIEKCGDFIYSLNCIKCDTKHFAGFNRCKNRWCLNCMRIKSLLWLSRIKERYNKVMEDEKERLYPCTFVLTIRDSDDIEDRIKKITSAWRLMTNGNKKWRKIYKKRFAGGVRSMEIKRGKNSNQWHVHFHIFVMVRVPERGFIKDFYWLRKAWKECTKGEGSVYIRKVYPDKEGSIIGGIIESVKYIVKPESRLYEDEDFSEVYWALKRRRTINTWGCFRGMSKKVDIDMEQIEQKKLEQFICSKCGCTEAELKYYLLKYSDNVIFYDCPRDDQ